MKTPRSSVKQCVAAACALAVCLAGGVSAWAGDKVLPIGASQWPPFEFTSPEGKTVGSDTEIIEQVLKRLGYTPNMQLQPWKRVEVYGAKGEFAAIYSVIKTPEREKLFIYSDPISSSKTVFFKRKSDAINWQSYDQLKTRRLAVGGGYAYPPDFVAAMKNGMFASIKETFDNQAELANLRQLKNGLVDLVICEVNVCNYLIKTYPDELGTLDHSPTVIGKTELMYLAFSRQWPNVEPLVKAFNAELAKFIADGSRAKIFKTYGIPVDGK